MATEGDPRSPADPGVPKVRRRGLRLSVVMAIIALVAIPMAWQINRARAQKRAVEVIRELGGRVMYDHAFPGGDSISSDFKGFPGGKPWAPGWLRKTIGDEYFQEIAMVTFQTGQPVPIDRIIGPLQGLDRLRYLQISACSDQDLALLGKLDRVQGLNIRDGAQITDAGLAELRGLRQLRYLNISCSKITDTGLAYIQGMENLEYLHLEQAAITDAGLGRLRPLKSLRSLSIRRDAVGDGGLAVLRDLPNLETLMLTATQISDEGLSHLAGLERLKLLDLRHTSITDSGLARLEGLDRLKVLYVTDVEKVTPAGVAVLKTRLPKLIIHK